MISKMPIGQGRDSRKHLEFQNYNSHIETKEARQQMLEENERPFFEIVHISLSLGLFKIHPIECQSILHETSFGCT